MDMPEHDELELLSAYVDAELPQPDRARLDAHVATCVECRTTLAGLQATVGDLKTLPEPSPSPQDSWALRAAIRRARSPWRRWQRVSWAAGAVAAAAIAVAVITLPGRGPSAHPTADTLAAGGTANVPMFQTGENLTADEAQALLLSVAGVTDSVAFATPTPLSRSGAKTEGRTGALAAPAAPTAQPYSAQFAPFAASADERSRVERCANVVRSSTQEFLEAVRYEVATFEDKPAFLLFFRTQERYELWVVARADCTVLFFAQA